MGKNAFSILPVIEKRYSVRAFADRPVEREKILACIEAARLAPSAENSQPWRFVVLDDPELKKAFGEAVFSGVYRMTRFALSAPVLILILAKPDIVANRIGRWIQGTQYYLLDIGIAGEHLVLQAQALGLGTCWIGWFDAKKATRFFGLPKTLRPCAILAMGYPKFPDRVVSRKRKKIEEILMWNPNPIQEKKK